MIRGSSPNNALDIHTTHSSYQSLETVLLIKNKNFDSCNKHI